MRQIKFRARDLNGYVIYGGISRNGRAIVLDDYGSCAQVDPASIRQLVGVDSNGREVYEGDILIHASGEEWVAALGSYARNKSGLATYNFKKLTLKEAST